MALIKMTRFLPKQMNLQLQSKYFVIILSLLSTLNLGGCYHLQLARNPLPVVYHDKANPEPSTHQAGETIRLPKNKPAKKSIKERYLYILENWF